MVHNNLAMYAGKIAGEIVGSILYFPLWWYSRGLLNLGNFILQFLSDRQRSLALLVWIKNIHKPMYGQTDWQGRLISLFMRVVQIIFRAIAMAFWLLVAAAIALFWFVLPLFVFYHILFQLGLIRINFGVFF